MKLEEILKVLRYEKIIGSTNINVTRLCDNSKKAKKDDLFFCYVGVSCDSHDYVYEAEERGAIAIVCERQISNCRLTQIIVKDGRAAVAKVARAFYGNADEKLKIIAVTGTNGKTTTTYMLNAIYSEANKKTAIIGTLGIRYGEKFISPELTTPDPIFLHKIFADMVNCGVEYVFMEVSAHAIYFNKTDKITFEMAVFTNCTQDHLDFFGSMREYSDCKKSLFSKQKCKKAIINSDDKTGVEIINEYEKAITYGINNPADVFAVNISENVNGTAFLINAFDELYDIKLRFPAIFNVYNAMAAITCARLSGISLAICAQGLYKLKNVSGRLEKVVNYNGADVFVDFAHTPDGLQKSLQTLKKLCKGKLYLVFGCGGNRDKSKRPLMGEVAVKYADFCVVTSDNPRYEDPYDIISNVEEGMKNYGKKYVTVTDRETAIDYALRILNKNDILLVAGKGGENYQEIMGIKHSFNDNTVIKKLIGR
ncbi:MAG: UDP-N-acetylmuramoyl-L-alanyl-D-glutamate--2,6-diaminopimelate ligase [Clostridia bacterium]|nr:UDP-N-acetylmuramoyl-L-alanyl-D-glutamate--2,6-diaminopimelate ligase [Clostridia bacterium]